MAGARLRHVREHNLTITAAYLTASLPHQKNPPSLNKLLLPEKIKQRRRQTPEEMNAVMQSLLGALTANKQHKP